MRCCQCNERWGEENLGTNPMRIASHLRLIAPEVTYLRISSGCIIAGYRQESDCPNVQCIYKLLVSLQLPNAHIAKSSNIPSNTSLNYNH